MPTLQSTNLQLLTLSSHQMHLLAHAGTPDKPDITSVSGSPSAEAPFTASVAFPKVYTADSYTIQLKDVNVQANSYSYELIPAGDAAGPFTRDQTVTSKGTYRFTVRRDGVNTQLGGVCSGAYVVGTREGSLDAFRLILTGDPMQCRWWHRMSMKPSRLRRNLILWWWACPTHPPCRPMP